MYGQGDAAGEGRGTLDGQPSILRLLHSSLLTVTACAALGAVVPLAAAQLTDRQFQAETQLIIRGASQDAVRSSIEALRARPAVDNVIRSLNLGRGEEFSINRPTMTRVVSEVVTGRVTTVSQSEEALRERLRDAVSIGYDAAGQRLAIAAIAGDPGEAAAIANRFAEEFQRAVIIEAGSSSNPQVEAMRHAADRAESALSGFTAKLDDEILTKLRKLQADRGALDAEIDSTEIHLSDLKEKEQAAASMKVADILSKPLPDSLEFTGLEYERQRYVQSELELERLSAAFGPLHPKRAAAQSAVDDAKRGIGSALRRLSASLQGQVSTTSKSLEALKARKAATSADKQLVEAARQLSALQGAAEEARENLARAESHSAEPAPVILPVLRVIKPALGASAEPLGPDLTMLAGGGAIAGLLGGVLMVARRRRAQYRLADELEDLPVDLDLPQDKIAPRIAAADHSPAEGLDEEYEVGPEPQMAEQRIAANDTAFGDRMRALLLEHRQPADYGSLPPLVASAVERSRAGDRQAGNGDLQWDLADDADHWPRSDEAEVLELRREIAELRERLRLHAVRRAYGGR
jgi:polysaccharide biosynthesis transport protein